MRVVHFSDIHISTFDSARLRDFFSKRALGGLNLLLHRREYRGGKADKLLAALAQDMLAQKPDMIWFTGDVTSLSLPEEFSRAKAFLDSLGGPERVIVMPGNHDCYTYEAQKAHRFESVFSEYLYHKETLRLKEETPSKWELAFANHPHEAFPYARRIGKSLAIVALSSAVATPPPLATGRLGAEQLSRTKELLQKLSQEGRFVVLAVHHPPDKRFQKAGGRMRHMEDALPMLQLAADSKIPMIIHGHEHRGWQYVLRHQGWSCQVFDAGSGTALSSDPERCARYNIYEFNDEAPGLVSVRSRRFEQSAENFIDAGSPPVNPHQPTQALW